MTKYFIPIFSKLRRLFSNRLFLLIILGLLIRYCLGLHVSDSDDVTWYQVGLNSIYGLELYDRPGFAYPPVWGYIISFFTKIGGLIFDPGQFATYSPLIEEARMGGFIWGFHPTIISPSFNFIFRTPLFITDLLIGYVLYRFVNEVTKDKKKALIAFSLWFFNPLVILVTAVIGQFDALAVLFALLAVILCYKQNFFWSGVMLGLGFMTKLFPIYLVPLLIAMIISIKYHEQVTESLSLSWRHIKNVLSSVSIFIAGAATGLTVIALPLLLSGTFDSFVKATFGVRTGLPVPPVGGFTPYFIRYIPRYNWVGTWAYEHSATVTQISFISSAVLLACLALIVVFVGYRNPLKTLLYGAAFTMCIVYITNYRILPQHLLWLMPFLVLAIPMLKEYKAQYSLITISGLLFYVPQRADGWTSLTPLAAYTDMLSIETLIEGAQSHWFYPGFINLYLREDLMLIAAIIGLLGIIWCFVPQNISIRQISKSVKARRQAQR